MEKSTQGHAKIHAELSRDMGLSTILAIGVGTMIAAGIFTLSGLAIRNVGSAAILSFGLAAIVAIFTALTYCEFVSIYPNSGEGYLYARKTFPGPLAYFVGWALVLGYCSSCAFYIASLASYFNEFIWHPPIETLFGLICLAILTLLNIKGTEESGRFQIIVTLGKVLLLLWFVFGGFSEVSVSRFVEKFSTDIVEISGTAALVFITFFGFSAIAATAGEVKNPVKNIPRAIFLSMGIVTALYIMVVLVVEVADLKEYTEASMGIAAEKFLGPIGGMVIVLGGIFSMISASNASIMAGSRVTMAMSQLGHFPSAFGAISSRTKTPIVAVILVGGTIMVFAISLSLEDLTHFANIVLLLVLTLVNAALIIHRRKFPDIERPFKVPLVPLIPILGIFANLYLLYQNIQHLAPSMMALASLLLGFLGFLAWKGSQAEEEAIEGEPSRVALGRYTTKKTNFRILVPLSNPGTVEQLIHLAAGIGKERDAEIIALRVALLPNQIVPADEDVYVKREQAILDLAHKTAQKYQMPITSLLRIGHNAARAILETAREHHTDLILMGWKGYSTKAQRILGEVTEAVVNHAKTDIMLVKLSDQAELKEFLLPSAGGAHAKLASSYVASIVKESGGSLTLGGVVPPGGNDEEISERLGESIAEIMDNDAINLSTKIIEHTDVAEGIIEAAKDYDAVVVGASGTGYFNQILFGSIPETIAKGTDKTVILVKNYDRVKSLIERVMGG